MKQNQSKVLALVLCLAGLSLIFYPFISDYLNKQELASVMDRQEARVQTVVKKDTTQVDKEFNRALEYNESLVDGTNVITDPFDPTRSDLSTQDYLRCLNIMGDGVMGSIDFPTLKTKLPIYHGVEEDVLLKGVGHLETTSLPVGGVSSHCVLTGHTGLPSIQIFDDINRLKVGDYFVINILGRNLAYSIYDIETVLPGDTSSLGIHKDEDVCTLVTCTPYGINTHRLLVHAKRVEVPESYNAKKTQSNSQIFETKTSLVSYSLFGLAAGVGLVSVYIHVNRKQKKEQDNS